MSAVAVVASEENEKEAPNSKENGFCAVYTGASRMKGNELQEENENEAPRHQAPKTAAGI